MQNSSASFRGSVDSPHWKQERLDSWKEVASFFRREVRTVQLWEKREGLPVRRQHHNKLGSVYAYRQELEAWWAARSAIQVRPDESRLRHELRKKSVELSVGDSDQGRIITIPFEVIHSPLGRGPLREIIEKFAEGLKNELVVELIRSNFRPIIVPVNSLSAPLSSSLGLMRNAAREFNVGLLLHGSIHYSGNQLRISVQLIRSLDSMCLWSERFDSGLDNVLAVQTELAHRIAKGLPDPAAFPRHAREAGLAENCELASHACNMGFHFWQRRGRNSLMKALAYFQDAIELEPRCVEAHAGLADTYVSLSYNHLMPAREAAESARTAVQSALRIDRHSAKARNAFINLLIHCNWDLFAAERECRELLDAGTNDTRSIQLYSSLMNLRGRHQDAINLALYAYRMEPDSDMICGQVALAYFYAGDYGSALSYTRRTIDLQPQYLMGYALLGRTEAERGNWGDAIAAFERGLQASPRCSFIKALLAYALAGSGEPSEAQGILHALEAEARDDCFPAYDVSAVHAILNQESEALKKIREAYDSRDMKTIFIEHDPRFARLRNTAEYRQIASALYA
jgi:TolB-like protein/tetratricopeptide (TPR) repeat protein